MSNLAQDICSSILECSKRYASKDFSITLFLDYAKYTGAFTEPDTHFYTSASEYYYGDTEHEEEVEVGELTYKCTGCNAKNGVLQLDCKEMTSKTPSIKLSDAVKTIVRAGGPGVFSKVTVKLDDEYVKHEPFIVAGFDSCSLPKGSNAVELYVDLAEVPELDYTPAVNDIAQQQFKDQLEYAKDI